MKAICSIISMALVSARPQPPAGYKWCDSLSDEFDQGKVDTDKWWVMGSEESNKAGYW